MSQPRSTSGPQGPALDLAVAVAGDGEPVLLLHGFPHTREVWRAVSPVLVDGGCRVIMPDLRGLGDSPVADSGFDARTQAGDLERLLDRHRITAAHVVGFDVGAAPAFALAAFGPDRVRSLAIIEAVVDGLPGAEPLLAGGGPWWFGFHQVEGGLAEDVVTPHAERYIRYFLGTGSTRGLPEDLADHFVRAYASHERLAAAFGNYRAMGHNAKDDEAWLSSGRLRMPVLAVGAATVGDLVEKQLAPVSDDLQSHRIDGSGHIVPVDAPDELARLLLELVARTST